MILVVLLKLGSCCADGMLLCLCELLLMSPVLAAGDVDGVTPKSIMELLITVQYFDM